MWDFSILLSIRLILRTLPFLALRLVVALVWGAVLVGAFYVALVALGVVAGWNEGAGQTGDARLWLFVLMGTLAGIGVVFLVLRWLQKWALYRVNAAHVAVLVEYIQGRELPEGTGQIRYGQMVVREQFGEAAAFFLLDEMIRAVLRGVSWTTSRLTEVLPRQAAVLIVLPINLFLHFAVRFADEIMLAHTMDARSQDAQASARRALTIYGQSKPVILKNAFWLSVMAAGLGALVYQGVLLPVWTEYQAAKTPETLRALLVAAAASLALSAAFFGPFALICMLQVWFRGVLGDGHPVHRPAMDNSNTSLSERYLARSGPNASAGDGPRNGDLV